MNLERYPYATNPTYLDYEFISDGPNGKIKKIVRYSPGNAKGITYFNLAFGDWNDENQTLDDSSISNNKDTQKILTTVAATLYEFTNQFPDAKVFAKGSTASRTRLYQMGISSNWEEINDILMIYGFHKGEWKPFKKNVNYSAFFAVRR